MTNEPREARKAQIRDMTASMWRRASAFWKRHYEQNPVTEEQFKRVLNAAKTEKTRRE